MRQEVYLLCRLGCRWPTQMLWQTQNLSLPFPCEFYAENMLRMLALCCIYLHGLCGYVISNLKDSRRCQSQLEQLLHMSMHVSTNFLMLLLLLYLHLEYQQSLLEQHVLSLVNRWKQWNQGRHPTEIFRPPLKTQSKDQMALSDTTFHD